MPLITLLADIGGTNSRIAMAQDGVLDASSIRRFRNGEYGGLDQVLATYFAQKGQPALDGVCVDIAGPVTKGSGTLTNLDWTLREDLIAQWTGAPRVALINDMQAQGHGAADLPASALRGIETGVAKDTPQTQTRLVVNVGTGFNAAVVLTEDGMRHVPASESGHVSLPIRTEDELRLSQYLEKIHGFAAVEDVLSGRGLARVYHWIGTEHGDPIERSAAEIIDLYANSAEPRAEQALRIFTRIFGTVAGDLALIHLPFSGVYLVGGLASALGPYLREFGFSEAFKAKGRFAGLLAEFPIHIIEDDYAALRGAARHLHFLLCAAKN